MAQNSLKAFLADDWSSRLQLGYIHTRNQGHTMGMNLGYTTDFYLVRWENDQRLWNGEDEDAIRLIWGAEGRHEDASGPTYVPVAPFAFVPGTPFAEQRSQQAGFLETRFAYGPLSGDIGVRYEAYDRFSDQALIHAGAVWQVLPTLKFRANGGNGFRIPSYAERLFPLLGNLAVKPERGAGGDLGLDWQPLANLKLNLTGFYNRYDDLIVVTWNPKPSAELSCIGECLSNLPNAAIAGLEAGAEYAFNEQWRAGTAYTYTHSRNLDSGRRVPFRPRDSVRVWGEWHIPSIPLTLWTEGVYRGLSYNDVGNTLDVNDAFHINAQLDYRVSRMLDVYVRGENLGGDRTPDVFSFDHPGTAVYGGVLLKL
jgi:vitamin B12 transporter